MLLSTSSRDNHRQIVNMSLRCKDGRFPTSIRIGTNSNAKRSDPTYAAPFVRQSRSDLGLADSTIAGLIGHKQQSITSRYLHLDKTLITSANIVAAETLKLMRS